MTDYTYMHIISWGNAKNLMSSLNRPIIFTDTLVVLQACAQLPISFDLLHRKALKQERKKGKRNQTSENR